MLKKISGIYFLASMGLLAFSARAGENFTNPLEFNNVEDLLTNILDELQGIIAVLAVIFIVIGGIMYMVSLGDSKNTERAKHTITYALMGLVIAIAAPSFLKEISNILGWTAGSSASATTKSLSEIALNVLNFLLSIVGIISMLMIVFGGITYITSAGNENKVETAKKIVTYALVGLIAALSSLVIVREVARVLAS